MHRLSPNAVKTTRPGKHCHGAGLWLVKDEVGRGKWVFRYTIHGRRREMGLGSLVDVPLKLARDSAARWRAVATDGKDPIKER